MHEAAIGKAGSFGHDDQRVFPPFAFPLQHLSADVVERPGNLGQEDHVAAAGDPRMKGDPARMAAHYFEHHDPLVAGGGRVEPIEGVGGAGDGGIEAECKRRAAEVVVDCLRHPDHGDAVFMKLLGDRERAVSADANKAGDPELPHGGGGMVEQLRIDLHPLPLADERRKPALIGGAQDRAPLQKNIGCVLPIERHVGHGIDEPFVAAQKTDAVVAEPQGGFHGRPDDGIQARAVAAAGEDADRGFARGHVRPRPRGRGGRRATRRLR